MNVILLSSTCINKPIPGLPYSLVLYLNLIGEWFWCLLTWQRAVYRVRCKYTQSSRELITSDQSTQFFQQWHLLYSRRGHDQRNITYIFISSKIFSYNWQTTSKVVMFISHYLDLLKTAKKSSNLLNIIKVSHSFT